MSYLLPASVKLVLLVASGIAHQVAMTPPNPPAKKIVKPNFFEKYVHFIVKIVIFPFWIAVILDMVSTVLASASILDSLFPISSLMPSQAKARVLLYPSSTFTFGALLLVASGILRRSCYKTLGNQFRYEVSIQAKHRLVTSGPYSFVRHPSYLALYGDYVGSLAVVLSRGAYFRECVLDIPLRTITLCAAQIGSVECGEAVSSIGAYHFTAMIVFAVWLSNVLFVERHLAGRLSWEDEMLHKEFGKEWEKYAERVRWRIIPGIL